MLLITLRFMKLHHSKDGVVKDFFKTTCNVEDLKLKTIFLFSQLLQALQARSQKRSAFVLRMDEISPSLAKLKHSAVYMPGQTHFSGKVVQHICYSKQH